MHQGGGQCAPPRSNIDRMAEVYLIRHYFRSISTLRGFRGPLLSWSTTLTLLPRCTETGLSINPRIKRDAKMAMGASDGGPGISWLR